VTSLRFTILPGSYAVARLAADAEVPAAALASGFASVTRTAAELSIVCPEEAVPAGARVEGGWAILGLVGPFPFSMVGVLASVLVPLADAGVSIFALSTFDTDYVLVRREKLADAVAALEAAGHVRADDRDAERP
jgi:hypothetical protein